MLTASSLVQKSAGSPVYGALTATMRRDGLSRPGIWPVWGPSSSNGIASENTLPWRTAATPRSTAAVSMRLSVPRWSSGPHRPALDTRAASRRRWSGSAIGPSSRRKLKRVLVHRGMDQLAGQVDGHGRRPIGAEDGGVDVHAVDDQDQPVGQGRGVAGPGPGGRVEQAVAGP